mmetsp:Transcript_50422/g.148777  ORF Transcript_50422/g.148777 Transcript_50422/m.148777 type:complete len:111 (+) Transcript_50422:49-381(+)
MVFLEDFEEFEDAAKSLFLTSPLRTRYLIKYRHVDGKVILKVTNDRVCLKHRSDQISDLRKVERLSQSFARWMTASNLDSVDEPDEALEAAKEEAKGGGGKAKKSKARKS